MSEDKRLLHQTRVQHLYARVNGTLVDEDGEVGPLTPSLLTTWSELTSPPPLPPQFALLSALHPTPAVCGHPQGAAMEAIGKGGEERQAPVHIRFCAPLFLPTSPLFFLFFLFFFIKKKNKKKSL